MTTSELIAHVGDENIQIQGLNGDNVHEANKRGSVGYITFKTDPKHAEQIALHGMGLRRDKPDMVGLVVWMPRERLPEDMR